LGECKTNFLKLFYDAIKLFLTSQAVIINNAFHQVVSIYCELKNASMNLNSVFVSVGVEMLAKYNKYWDNIANMNKLYFGTILDPQYKLSYIAWCFKDMYVNRPLFAKDLLDTIRESLNQLYLWYEKIYDQKHNLGQQPSSGGTLFPK
jgi:hypothetical protein